MEHVVIAGIDSVVGANCALQWSDSCRVTGVSFRHPVELPGCACTDAPAPQDLIGTREILRNANAQRVVYCGAASRSGWASDAFEFSAADEFARLQVWLSAAQAAGCDFTLVSSDAVFDGPWMFHDESSQCFSNTAPAKTILRLEHMVRDADDTLVVRTNAFGWAPPGVPGNLLKELVTSGPARNGNAVRYATPIAATLLADVLTRLHAAGETGLVHAGGAERLNQFSLADRLRRELELHIPSLKLASANDGDTFVTGETSLRTNYRDQVLALPVLRESLEVLGVQSDNGFREVIEQETLPVVMRRAA